MGSYSGQIKPIPTQTSNEARNTPPATLAKSIPRIILLISNPRRTATSPKESMVIKSKHLIQNGVSFFIVFPPIQIQFHPRKSVPDFRHRPKSDFLLPWCCHVEKEIILKINFYIKCLIQIHCYSIIPSYSAYMVCRPFRN